MSNKPDTLESSDKFNGAKFYDCDAEAEQLNYTSPADAIEAFVDYNFTPGETLARCIERLAPVKVSAFVPMDIDEAWCRILTDRLVEDLLQALEEDFGDPDGCHLTLKDSKPVKTLIRAAVDQAAKDAAVWGCVAVAERAYDAAGIEAVLRQHCPQWFKEDGHAA